MKKLSSILWGVALIIVGVIVALNAADVIDVNVFFDGWWTLFIIVPSVVGLFSESDKTGSIIGIIVGVLLLLASQDVISFSLIWKLALPIVIVIIGVKLIMNGVFGNNSLKKLETKNNNGGSYPIVNAVMTGQKVNCNGEAFHGAELTAVFGGVDCDLSAAIISENCTITATTVFGGIDIKLPDNVNVQTTSNAVFGGVTNSKINKNDPNIPTVYINATCIFGGCDLK